MKKTKKFVLTVLIVVYLLGIVPRQVVLAEEVPPPDGQQQSSDPSPSPSPDPGSESSGDPGSSNGQSVEPSPSPSPSPDPCVSDCPPTEVDQTNDAAIDNQVTDVANTGDNTISPSPSPDPEASPEATDSATPDSSTSGEPELTPEESSNTNDPGSSAIDTGDAASQVDIVNLANTNLVNSDINYAILNIYVDENGNIDLTNSNIQEANPSANLVVNQQNTATVNNTVLAVANTGGNEINGTDGDITTGSASVIVNIINFINANLINSNWNFVLINIFGHLVGDIILPEPQTSANSTQALLGTGDISQTNNADITNSVDASANTGNNTIGSSTSEESEPDSDTGSESSNDPVSSTINTGNAMSFVNLQTYANANLIGGNYYRLLINNFGIWNGTFWGWGATAAQDPTYGQMLFNFTDPNFSGTTCCLISTSQENNALLTNQITASANTGGNNLGGNGSINTGNAFSIVNLLNFVNTNIINSFGFFGIINIFGTLEGDIGGVDHFPATTESTEGTESTESQSQDQPEVRAEGGQLSTSMSTNVGTHVNPGDTVTFFISAANPGTGPVYDSKVYFNLYDSNGEIGAVQTFDIGKLNPGQTAKISFGLVLANSAPGGTYYAVVEAQGKVGPDNQEISSQSQTSFRVGAGSIIAGLVGDVHAAGPSAGGPVATPLTAEGNPASNLLWRVYMALGVLGMTYLLYRLSRLSPKYYQLLVAYGRKRKAGRLVSLSASKLASGATAFRSWFFEL